MIASGPLVRASGLRRGLIEITVYRGCRSGAAPSATLPGTRHGGRSTRRSAARCLARTLQTPGTRARRQRRPAGTMRSHRIVPALVVGWSIVAMAGWVPGAGAERAPDDLDTLVAPIALYPDALVADILPASAYPVQVVEAARAV